MSENFDSSEAEFDGADKRARDADREEVMALLDSAMSDGQLDGVEHRDRVATALRASTLGELADLVDDLQVAEPSFRRNETAEAAVDAAEETEDESITATPAGAAAAQSSAAFVPKLLGAIAIVIFSLVVIGIISAADTDSSEPTTPRIPNQGMPNLPFPTQGLHNLPFPNQWGAQINTTTCDGEGRNCRDQNGNLAPDLPRDRPAANGPTLLGDPMASTNIRRVYESVVADLHPTAIGSVLVTAASTTATIATAELPATVQVWKLEAGKWRSTTGDDRPISQTFAPTAMNLDRIIAAVADPPGIDRIGRAPQSVEFKPTAVDIVYQGPTGARPSLILAPDGTVVP